MRTYRKKPLSIQAMQWNGPADDAELEAFAGHWVSLGISPYITTSEGSMRVSPGDWVIRGIKGEFYPCKPDVFEATYEPDDDFSLMVQNIPVPIHEVGRDGTRFVATLATEEAAEKNPAA